MKYIVCALLSAAGYYFSIGLGDQWWLAWFAPLPVLWLAFGPSRAWPVFLSAWASMALGSMSVLRAYAGALPSPVLWMILAIPSLAFAIAVLGARRVQQRLGPVAGMLAFAALWAALDLLISFSRGGGSVQTPAAAEVGMPALVQCASLAGFSSITFLLGLIPAGMAASGRSRTRLPLLIALACFSANALFGLWRISQPPNGTLRVALVESDAAVGKIADAERDSALKVIDAYVAAIDGIKGAHVQLLLLPENIANIAPEWRAQAQDKLAAAAERQHATLVAGFNTPLEGARRNVSWAFSPGTPVVTYEKRHLVPGPESVYTPGPGPQVLASGIGLEICKDMDYQRMLRADAVATHPRLLAVPAWDFDRDDWSHARVAVLRSVENGVPMARAARDGLLTLNDRYGRIVARLRTGAGFSVLVGELPLDGRGGETLYDRIGDAFGWACALVGLGLVLLSGKTRLRGSAGAKPA